MTQRLHVKIRVYDLLPPSNLSWALNTLGTGVYHSSVELPRPESSYTSNASYGLEIAFGGHDVAQQTGIFTLPAGSAAERMPGLRPYLAIDAGECFGDDWESEFGAAKPARPRVLRRKTSATSVGGSSMMRWHDRVERSESTVTLAGPPYTGPESSRSSSHFGATTSDDLPIDDQEEVELGSQKPSREQDQEQHVLARAWRVVEQMKTEEEWTGTKYSLLHRNCNNFTDELLYRLTGRRAPGWINRASWVATSVPCLVPAGWVDEVDEVAPDAPTPAAIRAAPPAQDRQMFIQSSH